MKFTKTILALAICTSLAGHIFAADLSITEDKKEAAKAADQKNTKAPSEEAGFALKLQAALQEGSLENAIALFDSMPASLASNPDLQKL
ncbi:MAG: hypothetical protein IK094_10725, partial [Treponema sp.]|nr:hypothetical protein [Treponema sp.]